MLLSCSSYIFKPVDCKVEPFEKLNRCILNQLLHKFYLLWKVEALRNIVVFPSGIIGLPDPCTQVELYSSVAKSIAYLYCKMKCSLNERDCNRFIENLGCGHPIILYDNLLHENQQWKRGEHLCLNQMI